MREHFPIVLSRDSRSENAVALCFDEHLYPTGDPLWSDDALGVLFLQQLPAIFPELAAAPGATLIKVASVAALAEKRCWRIPTGRDNEQTSFL